MELPIHQFKISDFKSVCDKCDKTIEGEDYVCEYWMHRTRYYGNSILRKTYCDKCVKMFDLYDGRKEVVCETCLKYINIFLAKPQFLAALYQIYCSCDILQDYLESFHNEHDTPEEFNKFLSVIVDLQNNENKNYISQIDNIDMEKVLHYIKNGFDE